MLSELRSRFKKHDQMCYFAAVLLLCLHKYEPTEAMESVN